MPESATDRPATAHEYVFLLSRSARYFYDAEAVREAYAPASVADGRGNGDGHRRERAYPGAPSNGGTNLGGNAHGGRNLRTVWRIPTQPYPGAHFATFPERLVEPCIKAGTSEKGACPACGAPWVREVAVEYRSSTYGQSETPDSPGSNAQKGMDAKRNKLFPERKLANVTTTGWRPGCECDAGDPVPCVVLDPFAGSGTVGIVAARLGQAFVGIDLAGGDKCLGAQRDGADLCRHGRATDNCHTAHERLAAARDGRGLSEWQGHREAGQGELFD